MRTLCARRTLLGAALISVLAITAGAAQAGIEVEVTSAGLSVHRLAGTERLQVWLSGPRGVAVEREFEPGEARLVALVDADGEALGDGEYTYEVRILDLAREGRGEGALPVLAGSFRLLGGTVQAASRDARAAAATADAGKTGAPAPDDVVISDDLIVVGRACIGFECDNGESFGAETAKLKDKDTRLKFQDTSTDSGVPTTDWQLTANDTSSSGVSRFSLDDLDAGTTPVTVRGAAPTHSLYITPSGYVGLGTSAPLTQLHVVGAGTPGQIRVTNTADTSALRTLLSLTNNGATRLTLSRVDTQQTWAIDHHDNNTFVVDYITNSGQEFVLGSSGNLTIAGTLTQNSDRNTKDGVRSVDPQGVLAKVASLPISTWHYKGDAEGVKHMGPMAQDFAAAFGLGADERHLAPVDVGGVALAAIQALNAALTQKDAQLQALEQQNLELAARLAALEQALAAK
jgi:hypothetical protein